MLHLVLSLILLDPLADAAKFVTQVIQTLPAWEKDSLAQYEQPELTAVRRDLDRCMGDTLEDDFLEDATRLERDWYKLEALDKNLQRNKVL
jgi:hypothetical protein